MIAVAPEGPAAAAGIVGIKVKLIQNGPFTIQNLDADSADIIVKIDDLPVRSADDLLSFIEAKKAGQVVTLTVFRDGKLQKIPLKLSSGN